MSLLDLASLVLSPTATKKGKVYSAIPDTGDGDMTFTRGSSATRVNSEGLIEKERGNLLTYSNDFSNWSQTRNTVTSNTTTAPDGTTTADKIAASSTFVANTSRVYQNTTVSSVNTISVYAKPNEITQMLIYGLGANNGIYFDLDNGSFLSYHSGTTNIVDYNINNEGNGWYRYSITFSVTNTRYEIYLSKNENHVNNFTEGEGFFLWDAQAENGLVAQSYIETTTSAVYEGITDDVPRVDYSGGGCPSLLLESQRSNVLPQSEYFGAYSVNNGTATANQIISPEGILNAYQFTENTGTSAHYIDTTSISVTSGNSYVISLFAKYDGRFLTIQGSSSIISSNYATFNLQTGVVEQENIGDASIEDYGNGWYRCIFKITATGTGSGAITILLNDSATGGRSRSYTGNGQSGIYIYGFQVEAGSYSTSYIPTYSVSSTRVADFAIKSNASNLIGQTEGTIFIEFTRENNSVGTFSISANNVGTRIYIGTNESGLICQVRNGYAQQVYFSTAQTEGTKYKCAIAYATNDFVLYMNGTQIGTDTSGTVPECNTIRTDDAGGANLNQPLNQAILFPTRLTNDQLEELTK